MQEVFNMKFVRLKPIRIVPKSESGKAHRMVECVCECGNKNICRLSHLCSERTKSCGCLQKELISIRKSKHGLSSHPLFYIWSSMKERCQNINHKSYKYYGGRGIKICDEWGDFISFYTWAIKTGWRKGLFIDRIDNDKGYDGDNCRFVTPVESNKNRRCTRIITYNGISKTLAEWADEMGINKRTLWARLFRKNRNNMSVGDSLKK